MSMHERFMTSIFQHHLSTDSPLVWILQLNTLAFAKYLWGLAASRSQSHSGYLSSIQNLGEIDKIEASWSLLLLTVCGDMPMPSSQWALQTNCPQLSPLSQIDIEMTLAVTFLSLESLIHYVLMVSCYTWIHTQFILGGEGGWIHFSWLTQNGQWIPFEYCNFKMAV